MEISARIAQMEWLDRFALPTQRFARHVFETLGQEFEDFLHGKFLGHPLHPVLVHLPVGAFLVAALTDPFAPGIATVAIVLGVIGAVPAALAGLADWHVYTSSTIRRLGMAHALLNTAGLSFYILSLLSRSVGGTIFGLLLAYVGLLAIGASGYLGGLMVYQKRVGMNHAPEVENPSDGFIPVMLERDLPLNQPTLARAGEMDIVLVREATTIHAFANACAHQGGPLNEGHVENGCLVCPWHGSKFHLDDGSVAEGPSPFPQPTFECRVQNGTIEVQLTTPIPEYETPHGTASVR